MSGDSLVSNAAIGPQTAQGLLDRFGPKTLGVCHWIIPEEAEQALCAVFATLASHPGSMPRRADPAHWLCLLARHEAINRLRDRQRAEAMRLPTVPPHALHQAELATDSLARAIRALNPDQINMLQRIWRHGDNYTSLAKELGRSAGEVRDWIRSAVTMIHEGVWAPLDHENDDLLMLAAEYALGVLSREDAGTIEELMAQDDSLQAAVAGWGRCFSRLTDDVPECPIDPELAAVVLRPFAAQELAAEPGGFRGMVRTTIYAVLGTLVVWALWIFWP